MHAEAVSTTCGDLDFKYRTNAEAVTPARAATTLTDAAGIQGRACSLAQSDQRSRDGMKKFKT
jgi:hypothetical protein